MSKAKRKPARHLPDSRLRLERRPTWLDDKLSGLQCDDFELQTPQTKESVLALFDRLAIALEKWSLDGEEHQLDFDSLRRCRVCHCTDDDPCGLVGGFNTPQKIKPGQLCCSWSREDPTVCTACVLPKDGGK